MERIPVFRGHVGAGQQPLGLRRLERESKSTYIHVYVYINCDRGRGRVRRRTTAEVQRAGIEFSTRENTDETSYVMIFILDSERARESARERDVAALAGCER